jgi:sterol desaturase/sphingolipid hydroxylase (fatty acid hydroxylase superfamily)
VNPVDFYTHAQEFGLAFVGLLMGLSCVEVLWRQFVGGKNTKRLPIVANVFMWCIELLLRTKTLVLRLWVFSFVNSISISSIEMGWMWWPILFLGTDLTYYWRHRLLHETKWGWALHAVHHSSTELTLTSSLRLGWIQRVIDDFYYVPLLLLGFPAWALIISIELNHGSQFWCHTEVIGKLKLLDAFLNTPSNHRVHHSNQRALADKNYAATFILWDKLFGTYAAEPTDLQLGWPNKYDGSHVLKLQFGELWRLLTTK